MHFSVTNVYISFSVLRLSQKQPPNMESWDSDLSDDMGFVKIIKSFDFIRHLEYDTYH